ncbi:MAG TPA: histidinol dehydrogenase, partial [Longimicrobiaceae bacterium]|nr:histidinol dehydrogenase [Longimicrobiaceae bacterium]
MIERFEWAVTDRTPDALFDRARSIAPDVTASVTGIIESVRLGGDEALRALARRFDGVELEMIEVPRAARLSALANLNSDVRSALEKATEAIVAFHSAQLPQQLEIETHVGVRVGRRTEALRRVGVYAPGGRAAYASSVLMGVLPARVAGVAEVAVCSPPDTHGAPPQAVLAACEIAGADRVYSIGGAGAIAALALGTASIERVAKVVGPGNAYVNEAKRQLNGVVGIDCPAGPSELLIISDDSADPRLLAAEILAQAEHDPDAACVLIATSVEILEATSRAVEDLANGLTSIQTIRQALARNGALLSVDTLDEAIRLAEKYAPEHLMIATREPRRLLDRIRCAGTVFLGQHSSVVFGDYITGANHVLPTAGLSRTYSGLSTADFLRSYTYQEVDRGGAVRLAGVAAVLAGAEGLPAHAVAARQHGVSALGRDVYSGVELYDPARERWGMDLSDNTNLFGEDPIVREAIARAPSTAVSRYPGVYATDLKCAIAEYHGVAPDNVVTGCG